MFELLKVEWLKIKNYKTFWILSALFIIAVFGLNTIVYNIKLEVDKADPVLKAMLSSPFDYPQVWQTVSWVSTWLLFFPGFIMIFLITNEYTFRTHRQNIIDGWSRKQFVGIKLFMGFLLALICTTLTMIAGLIFGQISASEFSAEKMENILYFFLTAMIYILFAMTLAFLFRRAALAVGIFFIYGLIFDNLISSYINSKTQTPIGSYIAPLQVADSLLPIPFLKQLLPNQPVLWIALVITLAWIVIYHIFMIRKVEREDL